MLSVKDNARPLNLKDKFGIAAFLTAGLSFGLYVAVEMGEAYKNAAKDDMKPQPAEHMTPSENLPGPPAEKITVTP